LEIEKMTVETKPDTTKTQADYFGSLADIRKAIKPMGFKLKTESMTWGRACTYIHIATGDEVTMMAVSSQGVLWKPIRAWQRVNDVVLRAFKQSWEAERSGEKLTGLL
jgi:hypothetical protein